MDNQKIAQELVGLAKSLTAAKISKTMDVTRHGGGDGGRVDFRWGQPNHWGPDEIRLTAINRDAKQLTLLLSREWAQLRQFGKIEGDIDDVGVDFKHRGYSLYCRVSTDNLDSLLITAQQLGFTSPMRTDGR